MDRILTTAISLALFVAPFASAEMTWNSVERSVFAEIQPTFGTMLDTSNQLLGEWNAGVELSGPTPPVWDPLFERAIARAYQTSNVGLGSVPWASLGGSLIATRAFPGAYGQGFAEIKLTASFTLTEASDYRIEEFSGSRYTTESEIQATLVRGTEVIFSRSFPAPDAAEGSLDPGTYTLIMRSWYANGDTNSRGTRCDLRFTLPSPGAALLLLAPALAHRRRLASTT